MEPIQHRRCPGCGAMLSQEQEHCDICAVVAQSDLYAEARKSVENRDELGREKKKTNTKSADGYWQIQKQLRDVASRRAKLRNQSDYLLKLMDGAEKAGKQELWRKLHRDYLANTKEFNQLGTQVTRVSKEQREWQLASGKVMEKWTLEEQEEYFIKFFKRLPLPRMRALILRMGESHNEVITRNTLRKGIKAPADLKAVK